MARSAGRWIPLADVVDAATRSRMMSGVRAKNTRIEISVRQALFALGFRYRLHNPRLPGKPDLSLPKYRAVVFVHGCFWHGHDCSLFRQPLSNAAFWKEKILGNRERDARHIHMLLADGWRVMTVWECAIRGKGAGAASDVAIRIARWLRSGSTKAEVRGQ